MIREEHKRFGLSYRLMITFSPTLLNNLTVCITFMILTLKQKSSSTTNASPVVKHRKLKPTNPKPFKLRTDVSKGRGFLSLFSCQETIFFNQV